MKSASFGRLEGDLFARRAAQPGGVAQRDGRPAAGAAIRKRRASLTASGREDASLYTLRHKHASALHYAGLTIPEDARRLGHGAALHVETYAHVVDSISGKRYRDLDALFAAARKDPMFAESSLATGESGAGGES